MQYVSCRRTVAPGLYESGIYPGVAVTTPGQYTFSQIELEDNQ
nr:MAG TPA: hypothetical protein [Caudoviricetes sp.]